MPAKMTIRNPYTVTPPSISMPLGSSSPMEAIRIALHSAPIPIAVKSSPCPVAPTPRRSRANTGKQRRERNDKQRCKGTMKRLVRTSSFLQLNLHPSMMLRPKDSVCEE